MKFLLGTLAHNNHLQNIALALHEAGILGAFHTGFVDNYQNLWVKKARHVIDYTTPKIGFQLGRRRITERLDGLVHKNLSWELLRISSSKLRTAALIEDWLWERSEQSLDRKCARLMERTEFSAFWGVEHGALEALGRTKQLGKTSVLAFLSPHHSCREKWVNGEYKKFPELISLPSERLIELTRRCDRRRDDEARLADFIHTSSHFTAQSLIDAGLPQEKIWVVPLGFPQALSDASLPGALSSPMRFMYAGGISVHKGVHYLLQAWKLLNPGRRAELHLYGKYLLAKPTPNDQAKNVILHGSVPKKELYKAYEMAGVFVFPTLCDGFGMVVTESLAHGLPVISTTNAGAVDFVEEGWNGFVVPPSNVEALAERMEWCLQHPDQLLAMRRNALATARQWTWSDFRNTLRHQIYHGLAYS